MKTIDIKFYELCDEIDYWKVQAKYWEKALKRWETEDKGKTWNEKELKEVKNLKKGDAIYHEQYGKCHFIERLPTGTELFGVVIQPATLLGMLILFQDSETHIPHFLVDDTGDIEGKEIKEGIYKQMSENPEYKQLSEIQLSMVEPRKEFPK